MEDAKWYVVHTYSGYENKVADNIVKVVENRKMHEQILEVRVPTELVTEIREDGRTREVERKLFPGYVLVKMGVFYDTKSGEMKMTDEAWYVVRNTRGVTGFVGPGSKPVPLTDAEMRALGIATEKAEPVLNVDFAEGDSVVVIAGVWKDTVSVVQKLDLNKQTVTIVIDMFGRETPVDVNIAEVKKL